ncbi:MAG: alanyl-tRNA editing protein, partial [Candidatus Korarchaeota archaeon]|nr:alanyl-tRNA editing protein [Thermoproteota archaeon]
LKESHEIIVYRKPENPQVRIWKMKQWEIPCSGLHVRSTKEIGQIELKRRNLGKGKERIEVYLKE